MAKFILLTNGDGLAALVDDEDYDALVAYSWFVAHRGYTTYAVRNLLGLPRGEQGQILMHRQILGDRVGQDIDHINGDGWDNRRANLRFVTRAQNMWNGASRGGSSIFKGVSWDKRQRKWRVQITCHGKTRTIGAFRDEEDAARAYDAVARELFGEFARLNEELMHQVKANKIE